MISEFVCVCVFKDYQLIYFLSHINNTETGFCISVWIFVFMLSECWNIHVYSRSSRVHLLCDYLIQQIRHLISIYQNMKCYSLKEINPYVRISDK